MSLLIMLISAGAIIVLVKYGLLKGIDHVSEALNLSVKTRGKLTGYATSVPELVCLVAAGLHGVWEAGLWNIASSNIINVVLLIMAGIRYRQLHELLHWRFLDELFFAGLAILTPIGLMHFGLETQWYLVPLLLGLFVFYQWMDAKANKKTGEEEHPAGGNLPLGIILMITVLVAIVVVGTFLGDATAAVVNEMNLRPALAGWILGFATSIPEMITFFAVYGAAKKEGKLDGLDDTQEALDNLTGSNMSNLGFVYPVGLAVYLVAIKLFGS